MDEQCGWTDWENISEQKYQDIKGYIESGHRYQARTLQEVSKIGYVPEVVTGL